MAKGQVASVDLIASIALFMLVFTTFTTYQENAFKENDFYQAQKKAQETGFILLASQGVPNNWNSSTSQLIGIAVKPNVLDEEKLSMLLNMTNTNYNETKHRLRLSQYEIFLNVTYANRTNYTLNNTFFNSNASAGITLANPSIKVTQKRLAIINGQEALFFLTVAK